MTAFRTTLLASAMLAAALLGGCKNRDADNTVTPPANSPVTPPVDNNATPVTPPPGSGTEVTPPSGTAPGSSGASGTQGATGTGTAPENTAPDRNDNQNSSTRDRRPTY